MNIQYLQSACVVIENKGEKILCDPWLVDGCYYGSWYHYPKFDFIPKEFDDIDYIYISHIHPDHFDTKTLEKLKKNIPVLIHEFPQKYLKRNIEELGFHVEELSNNKRTKLHKTWINIIAADNCNPEICSRTFGCNFGFNQFGTSQIDTFSVFDNDEQVIVNTNDCPFEIGQSTAQLIKNKYKKIDFLLVGYTGASDYPACYELTTIEKVNEASKKKFKRLQNGVDYVRIFDPTFYLPFAGRYVLAGKLVSLMKYKGESSLDEAYDYLKKNIDQEKNKGILLNIKSSFDLDNEQSSDCYIPEDISEKNAYIQETLSLKKLDYEYDVYPKLDELLQLIPKSYEQFETHRKMINYSTETKIIIQLNDDYLLSLQCNGSNFQIFKSLAYKFPQKYVYLKLDSRLLYRILQSPKKAHWNNAEIGCHINWKRVPNHYDRALMYCLNFFHS